MRRHSAAVGATLTALGILAGGPPATIAAAAAPQTVQATAALTYLYSQVGADGSIAASAGATEDVVISAADNGFDPATLQSSAGGSAYAYLAAHAASISTAGAAAKDVLAWVAAGRPAAIDASAALARLNAPASTGGFRQANGTFHNSDPNVEIANTFSQSLAILADAAAGHALPAHAVAWLTCAQRSDGGFGYVIVDTRPAPPASCGDTSSDTNDSGIALEALGRTGVTAADSAAIAYLHSAQQPGGGFGFGAGGPSDPDSDAAVIEGLLAIGQDPGAASWSVGGGTAITSLEGFADPHGSGGFVFPGNSGPDAFTTSAIPQALALKPYGAATRVVRGSRPPLAPTPSPSPGAGGVPVPDTGAQGEPVSPFPWLALAGGALLLGAVARRRRAVSP